MSKQEELQVLIEKIAKADFDLREKVDRLNKYGDESIRLESVVNKLQSTKSGLENQLSSLQVQLETISKEITTRQNSFDNLVQVTNQELEAKRRLLDDLLKQNKEKEIELDSGERSLKELKDDLSRKMIELENKTSEIGRKLADIELALFRARQVQQEGSEKLKELNQLVEENKKKEVSLCHLQKQAQEERDKWIKENHILAEFRNLVAEQEIDIKETFDSLEKVKKELEIKVEEIQEREKELIVRETRCRDIEISNNSRDKDLAKREQAVTLKELRVRKTIQERGIQSEIESLEKTLSSGT